MQVDGWGVMCCQDPGAYISSDAEIRLVFNSGLLPEVKDLQKVELTRPDWIPSKA